MQWQHAQKVVASWAGYVKQKEATGLQVFEVRGAVGEQLPRPVGDE